MSQDEYTRALDAKVAVAYALGWLGDDCGDDEVVVRLRNVSAYLESVLSGLRAEPKLEEKP